MSLGISRNTLRIVLYSASPCSLNPVGKFIFNTRYHNYQLSLKLSESKAWEDRLFCWNWVVDGGTFSWLGTFPTSSGNRHWIQFLVYVHAMCLGTYIPNSTEPSTYSMAKMPPLTYSAEFTVNSQFRPRNPEWHTHWYWNVANQLAVKRKTALSGLDRYIEASEHHRKIVKNVDSQIFLDLMFWSFEVQLYCMQF